MVESVKKWREPVAFVLIAALAVRLGMGLVSIVVLAFDDRPGSFPIVALSLAGWVTDPLTVVLLGAVVAACILGDRTPRARTLTLLSLVVVVAGLVVSLVLGAAGLAAGSVLNRLPPFLVLLAELAVPAVVAAVLYRLLQAQPAAATSPALTGGALGRRPEQGVVEPWSGSAAQAQPTWQPDQAAGAAWNTAGDAAAGAAASGWGTPGESGGWTPIPRGDGAPPAQEWGDPAQQWGDTAQQWPVTGSPAQQQGLSGQPPSRGSGSADRSTPGHGEEPAGPGPGAGRTPPRT